MKINFLAIQIIKYCFAIIETKVKRLIVNKNVTHRSGSRNKWNIEEIILAQWKEKFGKKFLAIFHWTLYFPLQFSLYILHAD